MGKVIRSINFLLVMILLQGCIKENLAECIYRLDFNFRQPGEDEDTPLEKIESLSVFAFDGSGLFVQEFKVINPKQNEIVQIPVSDGDYTLVTWAGFTEDQRVEANLQKGISKISDLYMRSFTPGPDGNTTTSNPLYYGIVRDVPITLPPEILIQNIQLVHSAKPLNIRIGGMDFSNYNLIITNNAARYNSGNVLEPAMLADNSTVHPMIVAAPAVAFTTHAPRGTYTYSANASLLWPHALGDQQIIIKDLNSGYVILTLSLSDLLKKLPNVDFNKEHNIDLVINYLSDVNIEVIINGWRIVYSDDEF